MWKEFKMFWNWFLASGLFLSLNSNLFSQAQDSIRIRTVPAAGKVWMMDCENGFGGGNVAVMAGDEGVLLVDAMYASMTEKLKKAATSLSNLPIRWVVNSHFHRDHIEGNKNLRTSAVIIGQENIAKRLRSKHTQTTPTLDMMPSVFLSDSLILTVNGEDIRIIHIPGSHTSADVVVYFTQSNVLHLGDLFFHGMFPGVYSDGGGNIHQLIASLDKIEKMFPADVKIIPGHGPLATMPALHEYIIMLKETVTAAEEGLWNKQTSDQLLKAPVFQKYNYLGEGGAQTTEQYINMLYKLLSESK